MNYIMKPITPVILVAKHALIKLEITATKQVNIEVLQVKFVT